MHDESMLIVFCMSPGSGGRISGLCFFRNGFVGELFWLDSSFANTNLISKKPSVCKKVIESSFHFEGIWIANETEVQTSTQFH
jgi:hypothetical protein